MATPTEGQIQNQFSAAIKIIDEIRNFGAYNTPNFLGMQDALVQILDTDFADAATAAVATVRGGISSSLGNGGTLMSPWLRTYGKFIEAPETDDQDLIDRLYQHFIDNTLTVQTRNFSFGSPTPDGGNTGTGVVNRLNKDRYNHDIENQTPDDKVATCLRDSNSGTEEHEEIFEIRGANPPQDNLERGVSGFGSGLVNEEVRALSARDSENLLDNPSFSTTGTPFDAWTAVGSASNYAQDTTNYYRSVPGEATPASCQILANDTLEQDLSVRRSAFNPDTPYYIQIAYNKTPGSITAGTLTLNFGGATVNVDLSAAPAGWQILRIPIGQYNWFRNFNAFPLKIQIVTAGLTGSYLLVDDIVVAPYTQFDGSWYAIVGGVTKFEKRDFFTWVDSVSSEGIIQHWFWRSFDRYLPSSATPSWADPT